MSDEDLQERFARLVEALGPWLPHVVIAGGWAHRLHRLHALADRPDYVPLMTKDIDVAVGATELPVEGSLRERLLAANFTEEMTGECRPPITYYHIGSPEDPFYAEFLVPLTGGETKRDGQSDATVRVSGVSAQKLRHLEILLVEPWAVAIGEGNGFPLAQPTTVRVPNPASYLAQKLLISKRRKRSDQARDVLYIHDTLQTFGSHLDQVCDVWARVAPELHSRRPREVKARATAFFSEVNDAVRGAAKIAASVGRSVSTQSILETCQFGLAQIF